jgi:hypothetical protein
MTNNVYIHKHVYKLNILFMFVETLKVALHKVAQTQSLANR